MRRIITLVLILTCLGGLASRVEAQSGPTISSVSPRLAYDGFGRVTIRGNRLGLVTQVLIGGGAVPIVSNTGLRLIVSPGFRDPGFETLELRGNFPSAFATAEFTPTVKAERSHPAVNRMDVTLRGGDVGTYQLMFSYRQLSTPSVIQDVYFLKFLNLSPSFGGILASGSFVDGSVPVVLSNKLVPVVIGQVGQPLYLQAQCALGSGPITSSFTNVFTLPSP